MKKNVEEVIKYWDQKIKKSANPWEGVMWHGLPVWNSYIDKLQMHYLKDIFRNIKKTDKVLDLGCGVGRFSFRIAENCEQLYGVDSSEEAIKFCKKKALEENTQNIKFSVQDIRNLKFSDNKFDLLLSVTTLQALNNEIQLAKGIKEIFRVVKRGGLLILLESTSEKRNDPYNSSLSRKRWIELIEKYGGEIEKTNEIDVPFLRVIIFKIFYLLNKMGKGGFIDYIEKILTAGLYYLELSLPKIYKNQSIYSLFIIRKA